MSIDIEKLKQQSDYYFENLVNKKKDSDIEIGEKLKENDNLEKYYIEKLLDDLHKQREEKAREEENRRIKEEASKEAEERIKRAEMVFGDDSIPNELLELTPSELELMDAYKQEALCKKLMALASTGTALAKAKGASFTRKAKEKIDKDVTKLKEYIEKGQGLARAYLSEKNAKKEYLKRYEQVLQEVKARYDVKFNECLEDLDELEIIEQENIMARTELIARKKIILHGQERREYLKSKKELKKEIKAATKREDIETVKIKAIELQELIDNNPITAQVVKLDEQIKFRNEEIAEKRVYMANCRKVMDDIAKKAQKRLDSLIKIKDEKITGLTKQNLWQRIVGSIFNKLNIIGGISVKTLKEIVNTVSEEKVKEAEEEIKGWYSWKDAREEREEKKQEKLEQKQQIRKENQAEKARKRKEQKARIMAHIEKMDQAAQAKLQQYKESYYLTDSRMSSQTPTTPTGEGR